MSLFVTSVDGEYVLTQAGKMGTAVLLMALLLLAAFVTTGKKAKQWSAKKLAVCAACIALACITSTIKVYEFPFGGSVTAFSMLFMVLAGYFYGPVTGILAGMAYGVLQFFLGPYILSPAQVLVDYPLAFGALGLSGFFWKQKNGLLKGYLAGIFGRFFFAVISGWIFFGEYAWEGWGALPYSLAYNACYIFAEAAVTLIVLAIPAFSKAIARVKTSIN